MDPRPAEQPDAQIEDLYALLDSTDLLMAYHEADELRCLVANRAYAHAFGHDVVTIHGRTLAELLGLESMRHIQPLLSQVLAGGQLVRHEMRLRLPENRDLWAELTLHPLADAAGQLQGLFVQIADLTRHHDTERALLESEERLARFMQASVEGILFHHEGHITDANPAACTLLGYTVHELMGRLALELIAPEQRTRVSHLWADGVELSFESCVLHRDGERIPVELIERGPLRQAQALRMIVLRDLRDRHAAQARLHYMAHHDTLTGLPNRQAFMAQLEHMMVAGRAAGTQLALLFIDLDHFKRVNESMGHAAGDALLKTVARRIHEQVRSTDRLARFGADEFMVLLPGVRDTADVSQVARKLLTVVAAPLDVQGQPISVTPSIGIALFPRDGVTPEVLIKHADAAMHVAKSQGRATLTYFDQAVVDSAYANLVLEGELGHAIAHHEFALHFQPQVRGSDGQPVGVEALIRWQHPERGLLKPDEFIALAEQHRLIVPISAWVLQEAARHAQRWHAAGLALTVAVNLSALQFEAPDFIASIELLLHDTALPRGWLELELTERMLMDNVPAVRERLFRLRALGVRLSVDDFGTGYSSLAQLRHLPIDKLKIDRSFVHDLPGDRDATAIASAIISLAHGLGLTVVAEGVETEAQRQYLIAQGCHQLQGMGISAPLNAADLQAWIAGRKPVDKQAGP